MEYRIYTKAFYDGKKHRKNVSKIIRPNNTEAIKDFLRKKRLKEQSHSDYKLEYAVITDIYESVIYDMNGGTV